jgi:threonine/homoserine/homoserine lactone efflux protein
MLDTAGLLVFIVASISLLLIPGPAVLYVITRSIHQGRRAGIVSVLGLHVGTLFHVSAAALGLSAILVASTLAFSMVKFLGAGYLIFLGVRLLMSREEVAGTGWIRQSSLRRVFSQGIVVNITNPKLALFFFAYLPQFVDPSPGMVGMQMLLFGLLFIGLGLITDSLYALLAGTVGGWLQHGRTFPRLSRYAGGTTNIGLGVMLASSSSSSEA